MDAANRHVHSAVLAEQSQTSFRILEKKLERRDVVTGQLSSLLSRLSREVVWVSQRCGAALTHWGQCMGLD